MKWRTIGLVAVVSGLSLAGCSDQPSALDTERAERDLLVQRVVLLRNQVSAAGRLTEEHRAELTQLRQDVISWQEKTGWNDVSVSMSMPRADAQLIRGGGVAPDKCEPCPIVTSDSERVCFLIEAGDCRPGDIIGQVCAYVCFNIKPTSPIKR